MKTITPLKTLAIAVGMLLTTTAASAQETGQDTTVVVPQTGYLPVRPSHPFSGPANMLIVNTNASNNANTTDIRYYSWRADTVVAMSSCYILVAKPGTYKLSFAEKATLFGSSNSGWVYDAGLYTDSRNGRRVYKFVCSNDRIGFLRDETCTADSYKSCNFAEGEHFFITITSPIADKIAAASGKTDNENLDFIVWHGPTPDEAEAAGVIDVTRETAADGNLPSFDLQGRRVQHPSKGLYIRGGKKVVIGNYMNL